MPIYASRQKRGLASPVPMHAAQDWGYSAVVPFPWQLRHGACRRGFEFDRRFSIRVCLRHHLPVFEFSHQSHRPSRVIPITNSAPMVAMEAPPGRAVNLRKGRC